MGFLTGLFGGETNIWTIILALVIIIALIFLVVWILKLIFRASVTIAGGRKRRLAMVDSLAIDNKRNIILIRRDDVEHLIMISNTGELLIEGSIPTSVDSSDSITPLRPTPRQSPAINAKKTAMTTKGNSDSPMAMSPVDTKKTATGTGMQDISGQKISAERLGLSRLLRKNEKTEPIPKKTPASLQSSHPQRIAPVVTSPDQTPPDAGAKATISAAIKITSPDSKTSGSPPEFTGNTVTPLRPSGILKPVSEMNGANSTPPSTSKTPANNDGSDKEGSNDENNTDHKDEDAQISTRETSDKETQNNTEPKKPSGNDAPPDNASKSAESAKNPVADIKARKKTEEVTPNIEDNINASSTDSAMNEVQQIDAKAMESIEEGTSSGNDGVKSEKKGDEGKSPEKSQGKDGSA